MTGTVSYGFPLEYDEAANSLIGIPLPLETFIKCLTKMLTHPRGSRGGGRGGLGHSLIWCKWAMVHAFGEGMVVFKVLSLIPL